MCACAVEGCEPTPPSTEADGALPAAGAPWRPGPVTKSTPPDVPSSAAQRASINRNLIDAERSASAWQGIEVCWVGCLSCSRP